MYKRNNYETDNKITVDINELQGMLSVGKNTARDIGEKANAIIRIGSRTLYSVEKIKAYMDKQIGGEKNDRSENVWFL